MSTPYDLVAARIVSNELLNAGDRIVVKRIVHALSLDGPSQLEDVNTKTKMQMDIEADIIYLLGVYGDKLVKYDSALERMEAVKRLDIPERSLRDKKYSVADQAAILTLNTDVQKMRAKQRMAKSLNIDIDRLAKIVFRRDSKLDRLTVNYRREVAADTNQ
jgi:hypothetical protein